VTHIHFRDQFHVYCGMLELALLYTGESGRVTNADAKEVVGCSN
jgi:hypothetical protein